MRDATAKASLDARVSVPPAVVYRELEGEAVLLHTESGKYFGLDEVGSRAWSLLAGGQGVRQVLHTLLAEYEVDRERLESDLLRLIDEMAAHELVEVHGE